MIGVIVLAAGRSSRAAPENKLLTPAPGGGTLIGQTVDHAVACRVGPVLVVTGHQAEQVRMALSEKPVRLIHVADFVEGMAASLRAGIAALDGQMQGALICLGDMPLVGPAVMRHIAAAYDPGQGREIIVPTFAGQRGNPVLWGRRFFSELLELAGDRGGRGILDRQTQFVSEIVVSSDAILKDLDTAAELEVFRKLPV